MVNPNIQSIPWNFVMKWDSLFMEFYSSIKIALGICFYFVFDHSNPNTCLFFLVLLLLPLFCKGDAIHLVLGCSLFKRVLFSLPFALMCLPLRSRLLTFSSHFLGVLSHLTFLFSDFLGRIVLNASLSLSNIHLFILEG